MLRIVFENHQKKSHFTTMRAKRASWNPNSPIIHMLILKCLNGRKIEE